MGNSMAKMTEKRARRIAAEHAALVGHAMAVCKEHWRVIGKNSWDYFDPDDDDGATLTINGDVAKLHYSTSGDYNSYLTSFEFDARVLWRDAAIKEAYAHAERERAEATAKAEQKRQEHERAEFERLRRKFEPTGGLRGDIAEAIRIETRIADGK